MIPTCRNFQVRPCLTLNLLMDQPAAKKGIVYANKFVAELTQQLHDSLTGQTVT
jgi:hypothetical protein